MATPLAPAANGSYQGAPNINAGPSVQTGPSGAGNVTVAGVAPASTTQSAYPVVTSNAATQNYNGIQQAYQGIAANAQTAAANTQAANSAPTVAGYNVSATPTGNQGETKLQQNGMTYYITPQDKPLTAGDLQNILSGGTLSNDTANTGTNGTTQVQNTSGGGTTGTAGGTNTPASTALSNEETNYQNNIAPVNTAIDNIGQTLLSLTQQLQSGSFPLSTAQQTIIDQTNLSFNTMMSQANLKAAALSSETGGISDKINATMGEQANIASDQALAVAKLEQGFQQQNYDMVTKGYEDYLSAEKDKQASLESAHKDMMDYLNGVQATAQKTQDSIDTIATDAAKNGADAKTISAIRSSTDLGSAIAAAGDSLQTATGQLGDYLQYKKDATANGLTPQDYNTWKQADDAQTAKEKESEAYGTAFATAKGKAAGEAGSSTDSPSSPVVSPNGVVYNVPSSVAPFVNFASNGVKYLDLSGTTFSGLPAADKKQIEADATSAGIKWIDNKNTATDVQNIANAQANLQSIKDAFDPLASDSAAQRDTYGAAMASVLSKLQANPGDALTVFADSGLDILKAISGIQGFRGGASVVQQVKDTFPQITDTKAIADGKIANIETMITNRENVLVGQPSASDQALIDEKNNEANLTTNLSSMKTSNPSIYNAASTMYTSINPDTGQPYTASDILQAFPELNAQ